MLFNPLGRVNEFEDNLKRLQNAHHSQCIFLRNPPVNNLLFSFSENGALMGRFIFSTEHHSYDNIVHGSIIAAVIDASWHSPAWGTG
jgi:hypothetical protein